MAGWLALGKFVLFPDMSATAFAINVLVLIVVLGAVYWGGRRLGADW